MVREAYATKRAYIAGEGAGGGKRRQENVKSTSEGQP